MSMQFATHLFQKLASEHRADTLRLKEKYAEMLARKDELYEGSKKHGEALLLELELVRARLATAAPATAKSKKKA